MACAMVYWGNNTICFEHIFQEFGAVLSLENLKELKAQSAPKELLLFA